MFKPGIICDIEYAFDEMYPPSPYHFSLYRYSYQKTQVNIKFQIFHTTSTPIC